MKVWALVRKTQGAYGHGEPPPKYISLECEGKNPFKLSAPLPLYRTKEQAVEAAEKVDSGRAPMIMELTVIDEETAG